jgi:hypothetical protein
MNTIKATLTVEDMAMRTWHYIRRLMYTRATIFLWEQVHSKGRLNIRVRKTS